MTNDPSTPGTPVVPLMDLKAEIEPLRDELHAALDRVLADTSFASGPAVEQFEREFAAYCGVSECVAVNSGTSALHIAMRCFDIGPGDEVVTVSMSFIATTWPILYLGAKPVFVDIDDRRYTMDPGRLARAVTSRTKAIVPVHLYGQCAEMGPILEIAEARGIPVIEDVAQAHGASYNGRRTGTMGTLNCFSFYPSKNLAACGEGGCLTTNDGDLARRARKLRDHAQPRRYVHEEVGYNYRMEGFQGAVLSVKLKHLEARTERRRALASEYDRLLADSGVRTPRPCPDGRHVYHLYVIQDEDRDDLQAALRARGIETGMHYPIPIHLQEPLRRSGYKEGDLPITEAHARKCLSLPMFPTLTSEQVERVAGAIRSVRPRT